MKKFALLIVLLLLVVFTGCSSTENVVDDQTTDDIVVTDTSLSDVQTAGVLNVGSDIPYPPMEYIDENGNYVGFDIELIQKVAEKLGVEAQINVVAWDVIFDEVKAGNQDVLISSITITPERRQTMLFSNPYFNAGQVIVAKEGTDITDSISLSNKFVGVQTETTGYDEANALGATVTEFDSLGSQGEAVNALIADEIDAIVVDYIVAGEIVNANEGLVIVGEPFTDEFYGIATAKGKSALMSAINDALKELKDSGEIQALNDKYIN